MKIQRTKKRKESAMDTAFVHRTFFNLFLGIAVLSSFVSQAAAQEVGADWISIRHAGMGFTNVAVSNESEAVFANPAGLARLRNPRSRNGLHEVHFPRLGIMAPEPELMPVADLLFTNPKAILPEALSRASDSDSAILQLEAHVFPSVVFGGKSAPTWIIGAYVDYKFKAIHQQTQPPLTFDITRDTTIGMAVGVGGTTRAGTFAYGLSLRPNARYYGRVADYAFNPEASSELTADTIKLDRTIGVGVDAGILYTAADFWLPTFGLAVRNAPTQCVKNVSNPFLKKDETICGSARAGRTVAGETRTLVDPTDLKVGFSITPRARIGADKLNLRLTAEASPIGIPSGDANYGYVGVPPERMLKIGAELFFGHPLISNGFALRGGVYASEPTWGTTIELWILHVEYASFIQQTLQSDGSLKISRQHMVGLSSRW